MRIALIATSSLPLEEVVDDAQPCTVPTRYGDVPVQVGKLVGGGLVVVRRAGFRHPLEPSRINYRAIALAMRELGIKQVLSTSVVGSLREKFPPGALANVDQFLDFTRHRPPTLFDADGFCFTDMSQPYCPRIRKLISEASDSDRDFASAACYVGVDGPRYESAAEVKMFQILGGDIVGHTGVTEVIMAREAGLCYATIALVANYGAGVTSSPVSNEKITAIRIQHTTKLAQLVKSVTAAMLAAGPSSCACTSARGARQLSAWN